MGSLQQLLHRSFYSSPLPPSAVAVDIRRSFPARACLSVSGVRETEQPAAAEKMGLKSKEVMELEAKVVVGTYARAPVVLSSGKGCKLYDPEGREYLDCTSGIAVNALGHGDPDWVRAVTEQAHLLTHVSNVYYSVPQDKANPLVKVLSAAVLLKYGLGKEKAVKGIENAVLDTLDRGFQTGNIYSVGNKVLGCKEIGEEVLKSVKVQNSHCCLN